MGILNTDWPSKRQWLSTYPYFQHDPTWLKGIANWSHPAQQPYPHDDFQWHSSNYATYKCHVCWLIGHILWNCLAYKCRYCRQQGQGHKPDQCPNRKYIETPYNPRTTMACIPPITLPTNKTPTLVKMIKNIITQTPAPSLSTTQCVPPTTSRAQTARMHASRVR